MALVLLRLTTGITLAIHGIACLTQSEGLSIWTVLSSTLALACSLSMMLGFGTPIGAFLVSVDVVLTKLSVLTNPPLRLFDSPLSAVLLIVIAAALAVIGPGAFSVDAQLFGRKEIVIR